MVPCARVILLLAVAVAHSASAAGASQGCLGEYQQCPSGECVLQPGDCGKICKPQQYLCPLPDPPTCVDTVEDYEKCPGLAGTHLDHTLPLEARLAYLVAHTNTTEQILQLQNTAPAMPHVGIPSYEWLNDDEHGIPQPHTTTYPNGCGLGATWSKATLAAVGAAIGQEARGLHNSNVHAGDRSKYVNGAGITLYSPNLNQVHDPRWGRAQEVYGEDPLHMAELVHAFVSGMQGNANVTSDSPYHQAAACCKHFAVCESSQDVHRRARAPVSAPRRLWCGFVRCRRHLTRHACPRCT